MCEPFGSLSEEQRDSILALFALDDFLEEKAQTFSRRAQGIFQETSTVQNDAYKRLLDEQRELAVRLSKLTNFLENKESLVFAKLTCEDVELLIRQRAVMSEYNSILAERIARWKN